MKLLDQLGLQYLIEKFKERFDLKQDKLTAGDNITIDNNVINAKFTDTVYTHPSTHPASMIVESETKRFVSDSEKLTWNSKSDTDTVTTVNGKTGAISKADIVALGIPASDTNTTYGVATTTVNGLMSSTDKVKMNGIETGANKYVHPSGTNPHGTVKSDIGLSDVENYGIATQAEAEAGTSNTRYTTPLRVKQAINNHNTDVAAHNDIRESINDLDADVVAHKAEKASQTELGHVKVDEKTIFINEDGEISVSNPYPHDLSGSPGSKFLIAGTMEEGFFGEVPASELITGDALASECGISQGTSPHSTAGWLKFAYKGEIQFVAKKPIRNAISWDAINTAKCVYGDSGDKTVVIGGKTYKVTLMRALEPSNDPKTVASAYSGEVNHHSEWNRLMCQIHEEAINGSWSYPNNIESDIGILEHSLGSGTQGMYSDADLIVASVEGSFSWCQEMSTSTSYRLVRGYLGVSNSSNSSSSNVSSYYGWRPVLRLEED